MDWKKFLYNFRWYRRHLSNQQIEQEKKAYKLLFDFTSEELKISKQLSKIIWLDIDHLLSDRDGTSWRLMNEIGSMKKTESWDKKIKKDTGYSWTELQNLMKKFNRQNPEAKKQLYWRPISRIVHVNPEKLIKQLERAQKQIDKNPDKVDEIVEKHLYKQYPKS